MKSKALIAVLVLVAVVAAAVAFSQRGAGPAAGPAPRSGAGAPTAARSQPPPPVPAEKVPAHFETAPPAGSLAATLAPEQFTGLTREAYRAVRESPQLIAQMPCYCHCDEGFGHKSLHSCFEDDHAAHCSICVEEALAAYKLQKDQRLSAPEIRKRIIAKYGASS